jgi:hypothetical protein
MCRSVLQAVAPNNGAPAQFEKVSKVVAVKGLKVTAPWIVLKSQQYEGRYFFFNTATNESQWTLDSNMCLKSPPTNNDITQSKRSETVNMAIKSFPGARKEASLSAETETTTDETDSEHQSFDSHSEDDSAASLPEMEGQDDEIIDNLCQDLEAGKLDVAAAEDQESYPHFTVVGGLGVGGYATVVRVKHMESDNEFAMKVVSKAKVNEKNRQILAFELQVMTEVESPFLQKCHLAFENAYNLYFILDLNTGGDLFHHLMKRCESGEHAGLDENQLRVILAELYLGLEHLHSHNIIHRDIKIENVMLDGAGHVKLIDFGLSREIAHPVESMSPAGSLIYMAPELIAQHQGGRHTDWWAFGVMAFELLTGRTPWSSLTNAPVIKREIQTVDVRQYLGDVSPCAANFICSLMKKDFRIRLGTNKDQDIMSASFFNTIDWDATRKLEADAAFVPEPVSTTPEARQGALEAYFALRDIKNKHTNNWTMGLDDAENFLV